MVAGNIRVLIVDDSALIREMISDYITEAAGVEVAGTAADGKEAMSVFSKLNPDVVTLDVEMPRMNGLDTLEAMLAIRPVPIIMVSSQTRLGADTTLEALERGALDYVAKPDGMTRAQEVLRDDLLRKIRSVVDTDISRVMEMRRRHAEKRKERSAKRKERLAQRSFTPKPEQPVEKLGLDILTDKCIALGISTGGPPALTATFEVLHGPLPPIVIVQHMPPNFTGAFAARLNILSKLTVKEAETGDVLKPDHAYVAPGGRHLKIEKMGRGGRLHVFDADPVSGHRPSADVMMTSAAEIYGNRCLGVIMTGMGRDGSNGCGAIRAAGGFVLGQDEATSDVYGMNKIAFIEGNVDRQFSLDEVSGNIRLQVKRLWGKQPVSA